MDGYIILLVVLYLVSIITIETLLYVKEKWGVKKQLLASFAFSVCFVAFLYFIEASSLGRETKPILLALNNIITVVGSLAVVLLLLQFVEASKSKTGKHVGANIIAVVVAITYPIFALYTSCYTGLDCL